MAEDSALKISALLAGGAGLFGAGVALGRGKSRPDASVSLSVRDSAAVELLVKGGRFRRERPGVFIVDFDGAQYRVARAVNAAVVKLGGLHFERAHWLAVTGMLEAAWLVLDAVPASRSVDPILLAVTDLPPRNRWYASNVLRLAGRPRLGYTGWACPPSDSRRKTLAASLS